MSDKRTLVELRAELRIAKRLLKSADAEIERLRAESAEKGRWSAEWHGRLVVAAAEIERLQELLRGVGANRYWEGRWRDAEAEIERLRRQAEDGHGVEAAPTKDQE